MKRLLFLGLLSVTQITVAQIQDAWVFFADKEDVQASIANPISILTQESIDRKTMHGVVIDERDVPVNESYISTIKNQTGITVFAKSKWMNCVYVQGTQNNIENLLGLPFVTDVEYADKDLNLIPDHTPAADKFAIENDQSRVVYNYGDATNQTEMIGIDYVHEQNFTGEDMIVAVMDSGFPNFASNPGFANIISEGRLLGTFDFFSRTTNVTGTGSHGISTSSDIGGFIQDEFVGTAPNASFYLFRTEYGPDENPREEAWWVEALERADSLGVDVVNTSLSYQEYDNSNYSHSYADLDGQTTFAARGANLAFDKGMLLVSSAGNAGNGFGTVATPADAPGVLTVGAVDLNGNYVSFSSRGPTVDGRVKPDVMAKGLDAAVISQNGNVTTSNGTSFSSPIMAGAVTSLWEVRPELRNYQIMQIVRESAHLFHNPTNEMGYGIPNFEDAYNAVITLGLEDEMLDKYFALYPNPVVDVLHISFPEDSNSADLVIYNVLGTKIMETPITRDRNRIDMSSFTSGIYLVTITSGTKRNSYKIVKQ
ncbi:S8 family peptidase [Constantimarinum furrinae]|uniref:Exported serine protease n=1 Tax=Constantimarinum furrinae TaxID=2562285 RepID=A0A7G8PVF8_9FLAO|nr:S8 family peptidase [Constantimarinum furrinae]QNJ98324.1 Putative exported serine protease [Constantimarinum furrinae]